MRLIIPQLTASFSGSEALADKMGYVIAFDYFSYGVFDDMNRKSIPATVRMIATTSISVINNSTFHTLEGQQSYFKVS